MYFSFAIPTPAVICFSVAVTALIYILTIYLGRWRSVARAQRRCIDEAETSTALRPVAASVIVYAQDDAESLRKALHSLLGQVYEPGYEVIVVNEGASEEVQTLVGQFRLEHPNLYLTFTPDGARSLSRKKLAITLGVKAARGPVVVITDDHTLATSSRWLELMMAPFADPACEVVLGCRMPDARADRQTGNSRRAFDYAAATVTWLSAAIAGAPYRGCSGNVAYRRQLFFDNKGFSRSLNLRYGDDDIFINEITTPHNTAVQLAPDAITRWMIHNYKKEMRREREAHAFTGARVPKGSRRFMAAGEWSMWIVIAASVAGALLWGPCNWTGWIAVAALIIAMCAAVIVTQHKTLGSLYGEGSRRTLLLLPLLSMTRPLRNIFTSVAAHISREKNYTWS